MLLRLPVSGQHYRQLPWLDRCSHPTFFCSVGSPGTCPCKLYTASSGPSSCPAMTLPLQVTATLLLPLIQRYECGHSPGWHSGTSSLPSCPVIAHGTSDPWMHCGFARIQFQDELIGDIGDEYSSHHWVPLQSQLYKCFLWDGGISPDAICRMYGMVRSLFLP
jgi:hypothetical protein